MLMDNLMSTATGGAVHGVVKPAKPDIGCGSHPTGMSGKQKLAKQHGGVDLKGQRQSPSWRAHSDEKSAPFVQTTTLDAVH